MKLSQGGHTGAEDKAPRTVSEVMNSRQTREGDSRRSTPRAARTRTRAVLARWAQRRCQEAEHRTEGDPKTRYRAKTHKGGPPRGRGACKFSLTQSQTIQQKVESKCSIVCFLIHATHQLGNEAVPSSGPPTGIPRPGESYEWATSRPAVATGR